jgi:hypothetical protein
MITLEFPLQQFNLKFKSLSWREEFAIDYSKGKDSRRVLLAAALAEVSGLQIQTFEEAHRILETLPSTVIGRVFVMYKGSLPPPRVFKITPVYKAPEPSSYLNRVIEDEEKDSDKHEQMMRDTRFSSQELREAEEVDQKVMRASKMRGARRKLSNE